MEKERNCSRRAISPLIHNIFYLLLSFHVRTGTRISLRDKHLFEITEVVTARVDCTCIPKDFSLCENGKKKKKGRTTIPIHQGVVVLGNDAR